MPLAHAHTHTHTHCSYGQQIRSLSGLIVTAVLIESNPTFNCRCFSGDPFSKLGQLSENGIKFVAVELFRVGGPGMGVACSTN